MIEIGEVLKELMWQFYQAGSNGKLNEEQEYSQWLEVRRIKFESLYKQMIKQSKYDE